MDRIDAPPHHGPDGPAADVAGRLSFECPRTLLERLRARYAEPHRHYHTWEHVVACLDARDRITDVAWPAVDLALLFHDAIYVPGARDNEDRSAQLLLEEGRRAWIGDRVLVRAEALVAATSHEAGAVDSEEACIVADADLAILGAERAAFDAYEGGVRREFAWVGDAAYAAGRAAVLRAFLARPTIFATRRAQRLWEERARANLEESVRRLGR
jgi:predicted metal-dependent HD superfamily phosphohydrolase